MGAVRYMKAVPPKKKQWKGNLFYLFSFCKILAFYIHCSTLTLEQCIHKWLQNNMAATIERCSKSEIQALIIFSHAKSYCLWSWSHKQKTGTLVVLYAQHMSVRFWSYAFWSHLWHKPVFNGSRHFSYTIIYWCINQFCSHFRIPQCIDNIVTE